MAASRKLFPILLILLVFTATAGAADPSLISLVMPDAKMLLGVHVGRILASPIGKELRNKLQDASPELQKLLKDSGFDPTRDLQEIVIATTGEGKNPPALFLSRGRFEVAKFASFVSSSGRKPVREEYEGVEILRSPTQTTGAVAFLENAILIGGDLDQVRAAIRRRNHGTTLAASLAGSVDALSDRYDIWALSATPLKSLPTNVTSGSLQPAEQFIKSIQQFSGGVKFTSNLELAAEVVTLTEKDATSMADALRFFSGFLTMDHQNPDALKPENIRVSLDAKTVRLAVTITEAQLNKAYRTQMARNAPRPDVSPVPEEKPRVADTGLTIQTSESDMGTVVLPPARKN